MRCATLFLAAVSMFCSARSSAEEVERAADQPAPNYVLTSTPLRKMGDQVAGDIHWCMVDQSDKPKVCFGLSKEFDAEPRFTFLVLFRTGKRGYKPIRFAGRGQRAGAVQKNQVIFSIAEFELPLDYETTHDPMTGKTTQTNLVVGDLKVPDKGPRVVIVDLLAETPACRLVKADLPACDIDLADKDRKTWLKAIDDAIAELKKKSNEVSALAD